MCKKIHRGGNAEQYHADKKYKEAVAVAVEAYARAALRAREAEEASLENLKTMLAESDDVDEDEDAWAADLEEELSS